MQLFTQLWPAVIEIISTVLCDDCGNEFNMAVIFELTTSCLVQEAHNGLKLFGGREKALGRTNDRRCGLSIDSNVLLLDMS